MQVPESVKTAAACIKSYYDEQQAHVDDMVIAVGFF